MDFAFTEEQQMLREAAKSFLTKEFPLERVAELADSKAGWDEHSWARIAQLGWTGLSLREEQGGAGMGFLDEAVLFEELGYSLYPGPYFATVGLALPAAALDDDLAKRVAAGEARPTLAFAEPDGPSRLADAGSVETTAEKAAGEWLLTGTKELVCDLGAATEVVVVARSDAGVGLWVTRAGDRTMLSTMDSTRRFGRLTLDRVPATLLGEPSSAPEVLGAIRRRALAALALEAVGIAQRAVELAVEYAKERKQFDRPIGVYQAISHKIADTYMDTELARSLAYWAAWSVDESDAGVDRAVAAAKSLASEAAVTACERSIQVHGGIGFTWEHILHRLYKRAQWVAAFEGHPSVHRAALAAALLD